MKNSKIFFAFFAVIVFGLPLVPISRAQVNTAAPVVVKQKKPKPVWLKAEVIHVDSHTMMVREQANSLNVHTFTYADKAQKKIEHILDQGGYQSGDKVKVLWMFGGSEALDIKGKPSKPI